MFGFIIRKILIQIPLLIWRIIVGLCPITFAHVDLLRPNKTSEFVDEIKKSVEKNKRKL